MPRICCRLPQFTHIHTQFCHLYPVWFGYVYGSTVVRYLDYVILPPTAARLRCLVWLRFTVHRATLHIYICSAVATPVLPHTRTHLRLFYSYTVGYGSTHTQLYGSATFGWFAIRSGLVYVPADYAVTLYARSYLATPSPQFAVPALPHYRVVAFTRLRYRFTRSGLLVPFCCGYVCHVLRLPFTTACYGSPLVLVPHYHCCLAGSTLPYALQVTFTFRYPVAVAVVATTTWLVAALRLRFLRGCALYHIAYHTFTTAHVYGSRFVHLCGYGWLRLRYTFYTAPRYRYHVHVIPVGSGYARCYGYLWILVPVTLRSPRYTIYWLLYLRYGSAVHHVPLRLRLRCTTPLLHLPTARCRAVYVCSRLVTLRYTTVALQFTRYHAHTTPVTCRLHLFCRCHVHGLVAGYGSLPLPFTVCLYWFTTVYVVLRTLPATPQFALRTHTRLRRTFGSFGLVYVLPRGWVAFAHIFTCAFAVSSRTACRTVVLPHYHAVAAVDASSPTTPCVLRLRIALPRSALRSSLGWYYTPRTTRLRYGCGSPAARTHVRATFTCLLRTCGCATHLRTVCTAFTHCNACRTAPLLPHYHGCLDYLLHIVVLPHVLPCGLRTYVATTTVYTLDAVTCLPAFVTCCGSLHCRVALVTLHAVRRRTCLQLLHVAVVTRLPFAVTIRYLGSGLLLPRLLPTGLRYMLYYAFWFPLDYCTATVTTFTFSLPAVPHGCCRTPPFTAPLRLLRLRHAYHLRLLYRGYAVPHTARRYRSRLLPLRWLRSGSHWDYVHGCGYAHALLPAGYTRSRTLPHCHCYTPQDCRFTPATARVLAVLRILRFYTPAVGFTHWLLHLRSRFCYAFGCRLVTGYCVYARLRLRTRLYRSGLVTTFVTNDTLHLPVRAHRSFTHAHYHWIRGLHALVYTFTLPTRFVRHTVGCAWITVTTPDYLTFYTRFTIRTATFVVVLALFTFTVVAVALHTTVAVATVGLRTCRLPLLPVTGVAVGYRYAVYARWFGYSSTRFTRVHHTFTLPVPTVYRTYHARLPAVVALRAFTPAFALRLQFTVAVLRFGYAQLPLFYVTFTVLRCCRLPPLVCWMRCYAGCCHTVYATVPYLRCRCLCSSTYTTVPRFFWFTRFQLPAAATADTFTLPRSGRSRLRTARTAFTRLVTHALRIRWLRLPFGFRAHTLRLLDCGLRHGLPLLFAYVWLLPPRLRGLVYYPDFAA